MRAFSRFAVFALASHGSRCVACDIASRPLAQTWPQRTVRLIVPLPPGTGTDLPARLLAERLSQRWGQPVVVENRQGGDGIPAVTTFLAARDDPHVAAVVRRHHHHQSADPRTVALQPRPAISCRSCRWSTISLAFPPARALKAESLADLVKLAKAQPHKLNWAATPGVPYYVLLALLKSAGIDMVAGALSRFRPGRSGSQSRTACMWPRPAYRSWCRTIRPGTPKLMFVTNRERSPQAPEVPTAREAGYPDLTFEGTVGIYGWRDMPADHPEAHFRPTCRRSPPIPPFAPGSRRPDRPPAREAAAEFAAAIEDQRSKIAAIHKTIPPTAGEAMTTTAPTATSRRSPATSRASMRGRCGSAPSAWARARRRCRHLALPGPAAAAAARDRPHHRQGGRAAGVHAGEPGPARHRLHHHFALLRAAGDQARRDRARPPAFAQCAALHHRGRRRLHHRRGRARGHAAGRLRAHAGLDLARPWPSRQRAGDLARLRSTIRSGSSSARSSARTIPTTRRRRRSPKAMPPRATART